MVQDWLAQISSGETTAVAQALAKVRADMEATWTRRSLEAAEEQRRQLLDASPWLELRVEEAAAYRVEGECGQWSFATHRVVCQGNGRVLYDTRANLPTRRGTARLRTEGFRELALFLGAGKHSFRDCSRFLARFRHQRQAVPVTTLRDFVEEEGTRVARSLEAVVAKTLAGPLPDAPRTDGPTLSSAQLDKAFAEAKVPDALRAEALANPVPFTPPEATLSLSADAVFCKRQKQHRGRPRTNQQRRTVSTCCATLIFQGRRLVLAAADYPTLARACLAAMVTNRLLTVLCCLLSDGERKLRDEFVAVLDCVASGFHHVLDWHHLHQRCGQLMSLALKGKQVRNDWLSQLMALLWHGCTDSAIRLLDTIPQAAVKARQPLQDLAEYLARRREQIPVYSVRRCLGLPLSSNAVEKANDRLVSTRQKGRGMSWSPQGSFALAAVRLVTCNGQERTWLRQGRFSLKLPPAPA
jgi:hypothetical protein